MGTIQYVLYREVVFQICTIDSGHTVEPLIKATPDVRTPLYKGHP